MFLALRPTLNRFRARKEDRTKTLADQPLNFSQDQLSNIRSRLRTLGMERGMYAFSLALLGSGALLLLTRRYKLGSIVLTGFLLQQVLEGMLLRDRLESDRPTDSVERFALKAERGDYGHLQVIPFR